MTERTPTPEPVVALGKKPEPSPRGFSFLGNDGLSALNILFLVTSLLGAASEYFGNTYGAVAAMLVFLGYGFLFRKDIPNIERFADSSYYQGFILTLFALLMALGGKGADTLTSDGIIRQFGVAIWTTFIGMSGRIFIIQFLTTARDQDEEARQSIAEYVIELNKEIETALSQLRTFRETVIDSATKLSTDLADETKRNRKETNDAVKTATTVLVRSIEQSTSKLDQSVVRLSDRIANLDIPADALSGPIGRLADAMADDLNNLRKELDEGARDLAATLRANVAVLEQSKGDLGALRQLLAEINSSISNASNITTQSLGAAQAGVAASAQATAGVEQLGRTADTLAQRLTVLVSALDARAQSYVRDMDRVAAENVAAAQEVRDSAGTLTNAFTDGARKITEAVREARAVDGPSE